jgi:murein DD-endopeptidase MepM/ murein hydrolase activator NlpD
MALVLLLSVGPLGCSSRPTSGFYHTVKKGENVYRIGLRYGVSTDRLVKANRIEDVTAVRAGTRLWVPRSGAKLASRPSKRSNSKAKSKMTEARRAARRDAARSSKLSFAWPVRGRLTSSFGRRWGRPHEGVDLAATRGTPILASESGRVIHSGRLGDYGNAVIVKHAGTYRTVYAHASKTLVRKGQFVEKGQRIALVGSTGRSTGPHLHFEIRRSQAPRDPILYLP